MFWKVQSADSVGAGGRTDRSYSGNLWRTVWKKYYRSDGIPKRASVDAVSAAGSGTFAVSYTHLTLPTIVHV